MERLFFGFKHFPSPTCLVLPFLVSVLFTFVLFWRGDATSKDPGRLHGFPSGLLAAQAVTVSAATVPLLASVSAYSHHNFPSKQFLRLVPTGKTPATARVSSFPEPAFSSETATVFPPFLSARLGWNLHTSAQTRESPRGSPLGHLAAPNRRRLASPPPAHLSSLWPATWTSPLAAVRTLRVAPGSLPLRVFSLALRNGRLAEILEERDGNSASFLLLDSAMPAGSLCAEASALPRKSKDGHQANPASWKDVSDTERRQRELVCDLLRTIPVYAVVSTETQQLVPAVFPAHTEISRDEVVPPHAKQGKSENATQGKKQSRRRELEKLLHQEFEALRRLEQRQGVGKARGLGLFFLSHRDAEVYLRHVQSQTAETALPVPLSGRPTSLAIATTSLANVYPLLLPPHPTDLPTKLTAWSLAAGASHMGEGSRASLSAVLRRALFGRRTANRLGNWVDLDEERTQDLVSRFILVPDTAQLAILLEEGGAEAVLVGTPLFFISRSPRIPWGLLAEPSASSPGSFLLYLNRRDADRALAKTEALGKRPWWRKLGRRPLAVHRTSLESFLEAFAANAAVLASAPSQSPFLLVPAFDSFRRSEEQRRKADAQSKGLFPVLVSPLTRLLASNPALRYLEWRRRKFTRDWLQPLFRRDRKQEGNGQHIGDLLPEDA
uniref:Transmembrane protein n=1 Tax=Neospora caninum (strain Liverpool) TaxID=572307 RepID=A0A0F7U8J3_NEOCL|nr:TPA: hypothetical protein BN1204_007785 [Neospora caninum Liverpool]